MLLIFRVCYSENQPVITVVCDCNVLLTGVLPVDGVRNSRETAAAAASCKVTADDDSDRYLQLVLLHLFLRVRVMCMAAS